MNKKEAVKKIKSLGMVTTMSAVIEIVNQIDELEKEPLYMVPILTDDEGNRKILVERNGEYDFLWDYENDGYGRELFTEKQIKAANEDFWKFAVLYGVEEEINELGEEA